MILLPAVKAIPDLRSDSEQRSFEFFRHVTGPRLSSDYDSGFWITTVLKFSHTTPAVRHAVLAVSTLYEALIYESTDHNGQLVKKKIFAFQQYNRAIALLREQLNSRDDQEPLAHLLLCVLFVCLEFIQRKNIEALTHLQQGRQLLHTTIQSKRLQKSQSNLISQHIVPTYMRSGLTLYLFGIGTPPVPESLNLHLEIPEVFQSVDQARNTFYSILDDSLRWRFLWKTSQNRDPRVPTDFAYKTTHYNSKKLTPQKIKEFEVKQEVLLSRLSQWNTAFSLFKASNACPCTPTASFLLLQILYHTSIIWTSTAMSEAEQIFDEYLEQFSAIIPLCAAYLKARKDGNEILEERFSKEYVCFNLTDPQPNKTKIDDKESQERIAFSFETGIVPVLFLTAAKCRHPHIRRAAVSLLSQHGHCQENLWKAKVFANIAAYMIHVETEARESFQQELEQEQLPLPLPSPTVPCCSAPQNGLYDILFEATQIFQPPFNESAQSLGSDTAKPTIVQNPFLASVQYTRPGLHNLAHRLDFKNPKISTPSQEDSSYSESESAESLLRPFTPEISNFNLLRENSTNGCSMAFTPESRRSIQSSRDWKSLPVNDFSDTHFGIPEHLRISDAIIGHHEERGISVTFFRKPGPFCGEWEIWNEFIQTD